MGVNNNNNNNKSVITGAIGNVTKIWKPYQEITEQITTKDS
jgi:hypothetical protein